MPVPRDAAFLARRLNPQTQTQKTCSEWASGEHAAASDTVPKKEANKDRPAPAAGYSTRTSQSAFLPRYRAGFAKSLLAQVNRTWTSQLKSLGLDLTLYSV